MFGASCGTEDDETNAVMFDGGLVSDFAFVATLQVEVFKLDGCHNSGRAKGKD